MDYSQYTQLEFRRKFLKIFGAIITMSDPRDGGKKVGHIRLKAFTWKDDVRLYTDEAERQELMQIKARQAISIGATYDVVDSQTGQPIISLQRKGLRSTFVRDYWNILDETGAKVGYIQETSSGLALARRYLEIIPYLGELLGLFFIFLPQTYRIMYQETNDPNEHLVGRIFHRKNPLIVKMLLDFSDGETNVDKRIGIAATTMLSIVDAFKNG